MGRTSTVVTSNHAVEMYGSWVEVSQDPSTNTSQVRVSLYVQPTDPQNAPSGYIQVRMNAIASIGEETHTSTRNGYTDFQSGFGETIGVFTVPHAPDGSCTVRLNISANGYISDGVDSFEGVIDEAITLKKIVRATTVSTSTATIEEQCTIFATRYNDVFTHSIEWRCGTQGGFLQADGDTTQEEQRVTSLTIPFILPASLYGEIPNAKSGVLEITCRTYNGSALYGTTYARVPVTASASRCAPLVSGLVRDVNATTAALTGDPAVLVRYASTAECTITAEARNEATIKSKWVQGQPIDGDKLLIRDVETGSITFAAQDSRGYYNSGDILQPVVVEAQIVPYIPITCNVQVKRTDATSSTAILRVQGNYFDGSFGAAHNQIQIQYCVDGGDYVSVPATIIEGGYMAIAEIEGLDYRNAYYIEVMVEDEVFSIVRGVELGIGIPVFDWGQNDFHFNVPVSAPSMVVDALTVKNQSGQMTTELTRNRSIVTVNCYGLEAGEEYKILLYTAARRRGSRHNAWRHPSNENTGEGYTGKGYANLVGQRFASAKNGNVVYPAVPTWMPNNGILQTEWTFTAEGDTHELNIDMREWLLPMLKPAGASFANNSYGIIGITSPFGSWPSIAPLLMQFKVQRMSSGAIGSTANTLRVGAKKDSKIQLDEDSKIQKDLLYTSIR